VSVAAAGVAAASILLGSPPWISLALAFSFALYGAAKKKLGLGPAEGLAAETLVVTPFAIAYLIVEHLGGRGALGGPDLKASILLVLAGVVTAIPLLTFAYATNRITLQRLGFIQYLSPSLQLALGLVVYRESFSPPLGIAFVTVIAAVLIYALSRNIVGRKTASAP
jgi:chloramphenicol-sensitive protein RarD